MDTSLDIRGPNGGWIQLGGHRLDIATGMVPDGQIYRFRFREDPNNRAVVIAEKTRGGALERPTDLSEPPFKIRIHYAGCRDTNADATLVHRREGGQVIVPARRYPKVWVLVHRQTLSTYAAAAPRTGPGLLSDSTFVETTDTVTVLSGGESGETTP